jgi:hypothetical protein
VGEEKEAGRIHSKSMTTHLKVRIGVTVPCKHNHRLHTDACHVVLHLCCGALRVDRHGARSGAQGNEGHSELRSIWKRHANAIAWPDVESCKRIKLGHKSSQPVVRQRSSVVRAVDGCPLTNGKEIKQRVETKPRRYFETADREPATTMTVFVSGARALVSDDKTRQLHMVVVVVTAAAVLVAVVVGRFVAVVMGRWR